MSRSIPSVPCLKTRLVLRDRPVLHRLRVRLERSRRQDPLGHLLRQVRLVRLDLRQVRPGHLVSVVRLVLAVTLESLDQLASLARPLKQVRERLVRLARRSSSVAAPVHPAQLASVARRAWADLIRPVRLAHLVRPAAQVPVVRAWLVSVEQELAATPVPPVPLAKLGWQALQDRTLVELRASLGVPVLRAKRVQLGAVAHRCASSTPTVPMSQAPARASSVNLVPAWQARICASLPAFSKSLSVQTWSPRPT